jgi:GT2 family glycosyltransferase
MIFKSLLHPKRLSIVIPHWNAKQHLPTVLNSLKLQTYANIEIIIADNASTDGSQEYIREYFPTVIIEQLATNQGFTGACNAGMLIASGEFIALLNNDTEVDPHWAEEVVSAFERHPEAGFIASKMMLFDKRDHFHAAGDFYRVDGQPGNRGVWQKDIGQFDREEFVFSACGGSSIYRRSMLEDVGLLDDDFFFSCEDLDLAWRAQLKGYQCLYVPRAIVYHQLSATGGGITASFHDGRNAIYLLIKDYPTVFWKRHWKAIFRNQWREIYAAIRAWRGAAARATLRGKLAALWHVPKMILKRRAIQRSRRVSITYLASILTPIQESPESSTQAMTPPSAITGEQRA